MDFNSHPSFYLSAPTSPYGCSPQNPRFYTTRSSLVHQDGKFEFEHTLPAQVDSFSKMSFADEFFCNGHVLPLKLPPRLQSSVPTSPRSFSPRIRNPFVQRCMWNDDFDPFMIALEKVSEETEGRVSMHRRSRSYSPFRTRTVSHGLEVDHWDHGQEKEASITKKMDRKGSVYSRWVRSQTMVRKRTGDEPTMMKRLWSGRRVRDADFNHHEPEKPVKPMKQSEPVSCTESKMQKVKSVLLRYASVKKETSENKQTRDIMTILKTSYFKRLSLSFKTNPRKKESNMKLPRCLGYVPRSPMIKQAIKLS